MQERGSVGQTGRHYYTIIGVVIGVIAFDYAGDKFAEFDSSKAGLGLDTTAPESPKYASSESPLDLVPQLSLPIKEDKHQVLWLGASQLHAINQFESGDNLAVSYANQQAASQREKYSFIQFTLPNANFHELLCSYLILRSYDIKIDTLLIALTYDDLREDGIRSGVRSWMKDSKSWENNQISKDVVFLREELGTLEDSREVSGSINRDTTTLRSPQEKLEAILVRELELGWPAYKHRGEIYSAIRNKIWGYTTDALYGSFGRHYPEVPEHLKEWNQKAFDTLIQIALRDGLRVCLYKQPHRPGSISWGIPEEDDVENNFLHNRQKYDAWHKTVESFAKQTKGVFYKDFELIVPTEYWGQTEQGRPDAFHFRDKGHRILAEAICDWLKSPLMR